MTSRLRFALVLQVLTFVTVAQERHVVFTDLSDAGSPLAL
jgi:hypothetical protein